uniref:Uncharacterized protein n=1 Tax=Ochrobactrum phage ORM_20 TaxID=2985243 RepID=A0A9N6ZHL3_9VIRU|nr:hypothetical protein ORM20_00027 [Ochrobactrum phage ORM_20]
MRNFVTLRNNLMKHIEKEVKGLRVDQKVDFIRGNFETIFASFDQSKFVRRSAVKLLKQKALLEFRRLEKKTNEMIKIHQEQVDLTKRTPPRQRKADDHEHLLKHEKRVKYLTEKYNPKPLPIDKDFLPEEFYDKETKSLLIFKNDRHNHVDLDQYTVEKIHDGYYISPIIVKEEKPREGLINVVESRYFGH